MPPALPRSPSRHLHARRLSALTLAVLLTACGGGGNQTSIDGETGLTVSASMLPSNDAETYRFLTQATFGPAAADIARIKKVGYDNWIDEQFKLQAQSSHVRMVESSAAALGQPQAYAHNVTHSWWTHAVRDPAQLRHRVAFALSEIFVISTMTVDDGRRAASYLDMLTTKADANYRDVLEAVALHPAMGQYLSHLGNRKEDGTGRVPDENFAREVMQLFSIGLHELGDNGRPRLVNGQAVETYNANDIKGLARVFTGFSWNWPSAKSALDWWKCFWRTAECRDPGQDVSSMTGYSQEHSTSVKQFLGVTVTAQETADPRASLKVALDRLASHPNTAPFISRQLIQRLVTSNPSDAYVSDVSQVFRAQGGNLRAVVKAILLHEEARRPATASLSTYGKLREPVLRLSHLLRALPHTSARFTSGGSVPFYLADDTSDPGTQLGQTPLRASSVFNFFRPGYTAPQSAMAAQGLVAPEMQITNETSVLGYANFVATILERGWGQWNSESNNWDIQFDLSGWDSKVNDPTALVDAIAQHLLGHPLPDDERSQAVTAITAMPINATNTTTLAKQRRQRIQAAILMVAVSPEFVIQQ